MMGAYEDLVAAIGGVSDPQIHRQKLVDAMIREIGVMMSDCHHEITSMLEAMSRLIEGKNPVVLLFCLHVVGARILRVAPGAHIDIVEAACCELAADYVDFVFSEIKAQE